MKRGFSRLPEYRIWIKIKVRCGNTKNSQYKDYGGRGIRVCDRWNTFASFYADMGQRPSPKHEIDRINNDKDYEPTNCRWATRIQQQRNKRTNRLLTIDGETKTAVEWSETSGIKLATINTRLWNGWSDRDAVFTPVGERTRWKQLVAAI